MDQFFELPPLLLLPGQGQVTGFQRIQYAEKMLALAENDLRGARDASPLFFFPVLDQV